MSPNSLSFLECKNKLEFEILKKLYKYPILGSDEWDFQAKREFDMTNNSNLFHTTNVGYPLYEGKMMNMFTHTFAKPRYWIDEKEGRTVLESKELYRMRKINKKHSVKPQIAFDQYRLVFRRITNSTNERTLISSILPSKIFLSESIPYVIPIEFNGKEYVKTFSYQEIFFICGLFNSFVVDFIIRHKIHTNLNTFYLMDLPIPRYDAVNPLHNRIFENSAKLICTTDEYSDLRKLVGITDYVTNCDERIVLEAQINAYASKIYGLTKNDLESILKNFRIADEKLKELTLNEFDLIN